MFIRVSSFLFITTLLLLHSSCSSEDVDHVDHGSIALAKIDSVVLENSEPLFGKFVENFRINGPGDVWIFAERNQDRIFAFDNKGVIINVLGKRGKGPKGIIDIHGYDINKDNEVIIYDAMQRMLKVFDLTGELIHSNTFLSEGKIFAHLYRLHAFEDRLLMPITQADFIHEPHKSKLLALVDYDGTIDTVFGMHDAFSKEDNTYSIENNILLDSDTIYTNLDSSPYIQTFNSHTLRQTDYFGQKTANFSIPAKDVHRNLPTSEVIDRSVNSSVMMGLYGTHQFIILHMQILTEEFYEAIDFSKKKNILVLYDKETKEFIKEIPVPHTLGAVHDDKLYFIEDFNPDNYTIGIYELASKKK